MSVDIICIGEALVEMVKVEKDSPHDQLGTYEGPFASGAPAIFASAAGRLAAKYGMTAGFIGAVGNDAFGQLFIDTLEKNQLDTSQVERRSGDATGIAFVQLNRDGTRSFVFSAGAAGAPRGPLEPEYFKTVRALHISGSSLALSPYQRAQCYAALELAVAANPDCLVTFDPNFRVEMGDVEATLGLAKPVLGQTTHLLPSGDELKFLTGESDLQRACISAFETAQRLQSIVLKGGETGCRVFTRANLGEGGVSVPGVSAQERYPTGAGDNFGGTLLVGLLAGQGLERAAQLACAGGALAVEQRGLMKSFTWEDIETRLASAQA